MTLAWWSELLERLATVDPAPLFVLSLLPYLAFLWWGSRLQAMPRLALRGFQLTLLFVAVTIVAAVVAELRFGRQLADVDPLHGGAESLLTLSNLLVLLGFQQAIGTGAGRVDRAAGPDGAAEGSGFADGTPARPPE